MIGSIIIGLEADKKFIYNDLAEEFILIIKAFLDFFRNLSSEL